MHACVRACVRACVHACVRAYGATTPTIDVSRLCGARGAPVCSTPPLLQLETQELDVPPPAAASSCEQQHWLLLGCASPQARLPRVRRAGNHHEERTKTAENKCDQAAVFLLFSNS